MLRYTGKRVLIGIVSLYVLVTASFFLVRQIPGSPFETGNVSEQVQEEMERQYGLDQPLSEQYWIYLRNLLHGDLGISYRNPGVSVTEIIRRAWPVTFRIGILAVLTALLGGTLLGIWQASAKKKEIRYGILFGTVLGNGIPNFVLALVLAFLFGIKWNVLPIVGLDNWQSYILPVLSLAVCPMAAVTRITCNAFQEELSQDYVVLARAKGLKPCRIAMTHVLRNAWIPVLNYVGPASAFLLTGSFAVESIFTIPGLGREFVYSIGNRDYTLILGLTVFMGAVVIWVNLLTDLLCALLNPEIRRGYVQGGEWL